MIHDWSEAYANAPVIPGAETYPDRWATAAREFRASQKAHAEFDLSYGGADRQRFDLFNPEGAPRGLAMFVHGGYWMTFDKNWWSHLAQGALARGWAVAIPQYTLAPGARIATITQEVGAALMAAAGRVDGPIRLAGHSAGGHLVSRMVCRDAPLIALCRRASRMYSASADCMICAL